MRLLDRLFGNATQRKSKQIIKRKTKQIIKDVMEESQRKSGPLNEWGLALIHAAETCLQGVKPLLSEIGKGDVYVEMMMWSEFVFFFLHMTNRAAHTRLTSQQFEYLHGFIIEMIIPVAIDTYMLHCPEEVKAGMRREFLGALNAREIEYASSKELLSKDRPFTGNSLLSTLARNVLSHCDSSSNPAAMMFVSSLAMHALHAANFPRLISNVAKVL